MNKLLITGFSYYCNEGYKAHGSVSIKMGKDGEARFETDFTPELLEQIRRELEIQIHGKLKAIAEPAPIPPLEQIENLPSTAIN